MYTCKTHFTVFYMNWFGCKPGVLRAHWAWDAIFLGYSIKNL